MAHLIVSGRGLLADVGLIVLAVAGAAVISRSAVRYSLAIGLLAVRGRLPLQLKQFLGWAEDAGLLREAGTAYQFRHVELQRWLAAGDIGASSERPTGTEGNRYQLS
jgi:hypothetical protein